MTTFQILLLVLLINILVLVTLLALSVNLIIKNGKNLTAVFLTFCFTLWLFTDLYWIIYDYMRPESRMPFAANEIGEAATFLMMAAVINSAVSSRVRISFFRSFGAVLFAVCNIALWIAWSGEWIQDLFFGVVYAWFLYSIVRSLTVENALRIRGWITLGALCTLLIGCEVLTIGSNEKLIKIMGLGGYIILIVGVIFFAFNIIREYRTENRAKTELALSFALVAWIIMGKYMSEAGWYNLFLALETATVPLWYLSVRKVVSAA